MFTGCGKREKSVVVDVLEGAKDKEIEQRFPVPVLE